MEGNLGLLAPGLSFTVESGATLTQLQQLSRLHHTTLTKRVLPVLQEYGLVEKKDNIYFAAEDQKDLLRRKKFVKSKKAIWQDKLQTYKVCLLRPGVSRLTLTENLVLWLIQSYNLRGRKIHRRGIATQVGISEKTVKRAIQYLRQEKFLDDGWNVLLDDTTKPVWADRVQKEATIAGARHDFMMAIKILRRFPDGYAPQFQDNMAVTRDALVDLFALMREVDYSTHEIETFFFKELPQMCGIDGEKTKGVAYLSLDNFLNRCMIQSFRLAEQITDENRRRRRFAGPNSLGIFRKISIAAIRSGKASLEQYGMKGIQTMAPDFAAMAEKWARGQWA